MTDPDLGVAWAHSRNHEGERDLLERHLRSTANLAVHHAGQSPQSSLLIPASRAAGLAHDMGKATCAWQSHLLTSEAGRPSSSPGHSAVSGQLLSCIFGVDRYRGTPAQEAAFIATLAVFAHHAGLKDWTDVVEARRDTSTGHGLEEAHRWAQRNGIIDELKAAVVGSPRHQLDGHGPLDMLVRNTLSCLVDADWSDAYRHRTGLTLEEELPDWEALIGAMDSYVAGLGGSGARSPLDVARSRLYDDCAAAGDNVALPPGIYQLPAPTGSGKTTAGVAFALRHAHRNAMRRVIWALPYITITEQNAGVYNRAFRDVLPNGVIEHHSSFEPSNWRQQLATTGWNSPIVVTTTVQLFETLLGCKPSQLRKLHRISNSVIVVDEVQSLPIHLLASCRRLMMEMSAHYGVTWLLCTATQPNFDWFNLARPDLVSTPELPMTTIGTRASAAAVFHRRVSYTWRDSYPTLGALAADVADTNQSLTILNTTKIAAEFSHELAAITNGHVHHLSTRMCAAHRRHVIDTVRAELDLGIACRVVSTQLIEAGVDVDFPVVWRQSAPAESIIQAGGRANRNARRLSGQVHVFDVDGVDHYPGAAYARQTEIARTMFAANPAGLTRPKILDAYFAEVYGSVIGGTKASQADRNISLNRDPVRGRRPHANFVSSQMNLIDDVSIPIIVLPALSGTEPWIDLKHLASARKAFTRLQSGVPSPSDWRLIGPYIASVTGSVLKEMVGAGYVDLLDPSSPADAETWVAYRGYDDLRGLQP